MSRARALLIAVLVLAAGIVAVVMEPVSWPAATVAAGFSASAAAARNA